MESDGYRNRPVSWVRRGVRMTEGQELAWQQHGQKYLIEPPRGIARESITPGWVLDPVSEFGGRGFDRRSAGSTDGPTKFVIEIGTGRGENIVSAAAREPDTNFLGVEVYGPGLARAILLAESAGTGNPLPHLGPGIAEAVANANIPVVSTAADAGGATGLANLRLIQADAPELLEALPESSVDEFWIFFPDPWPKTKHLKRRLIDPEFAEQLAKVLKPGGIVRLATDWEHYAEQMAEVFAASPAFEQLETGRFEGRVLTAFETKGIKEGRSITDLAFRRIAN